MRWLQARGSGDEVGGFGLCSAGRGVIYVHDIALVKQEVSGAVVDFCEEGVAEYMEACLDAGLVHDQFLRVWIHTHPFKSNTPSAKDWETFHSTLGTFPWAAMLIMANDYTWSGHLRVTCGPLSVHMPCDIKHTYDQARWPAVMSVTDWEAEFTRLVTRRTDVRSVTFPNGMPDDDDDDPRDWYRRRTARCEPGVPGQRSTLSQLGPLKAVNIFTPELDKRGRVKCVERYWVSVATNRIETPYGDWRVVDPKLMLQILRSWGKRKRRDHRLHGRALSEFNEFQADLKAAVAAGIQRYHMSWRSYQGAQLQLQGD